jgi:hypothetical protein
MNRKGIIMNPILVELYSKEEKKLLRRELKIRRQSGQAKRETH